MKNGIILEIAVAGVASRPLPEAIGAHWPDRPVDHYWRIRWFEDGEQVDATTEINSLGEMEHQARAFYAGGEPVAWRYYETGV